MSPADPLPACASIVSVLEFVRNVQFPISMFPPPALGEMPDTDVPFTVAFTPALTWMIPPVLELVTALRVLAGLPAVISRMSAFAIRLNVEEPCRLVLSKNSEPPDPVAEIVAAPDPDFVKFVSVTS